MPGNLAGASRRGDPELQYFFGRHGAICLFLSGGLSKNAGAHHKKRSGSKMAGVYERFAGAAGGHPGDGNF